MANNKFTDFLINNEQAIEKNTVFKRRFSYRDTSEIYELY